MVTKKYTQFGTMSVLIMVPLFLFFCGMTIRSGLTSSSDFMILLFVSILLLACCVTFYQLTITVTQTQVSFKMGIGLFGKTYQMSDIRQCRPVSNSFIAGIGIKLLPNGWLYNVSGIKAIELQFKNKYSIVRIGTNKPEEISEFIQSIITGRYATYANAEQPARRWINPMWGLMILVVAALLTAPALLKTNAICESTALKIKGLYGLTIPYTEIEKVDTISVLPAISRKTNGYALGKTLIGNFKFSDNTSAKLFVKEGNKPLIKIQSKGRAPVYFNRAERSQTIELFNQIRSKTEASQK